MQKLGKIAVFLALVMYLMVPLAPLWAQDSSGFQIEICSGDSWEIITLDENGNEIPMPSDNGPKSKKCNVCVVSLATIDTPNSFVVNVERVNAEYVAHETHQNFRVFTLNPNALAQGPPAFS